MTTPSLPQPDCKDVDVTMLAKTDAPGKLDRQLVLELLAGVLQVADDHALVALAGCHALACVPPLARQHAQHVQCVVPLLLRLQQSNNERRAAWGLACTGVHGLRSLRRLSHAVAARWCACLPDWLLDETQACRAAAASGGSKLLPAGLGLSELSRDITCAQYSACGAAVTCVGASCQACLSKAHEQTPAHLLRGHDLVEHQAQHDLAWHVQVLHRVHLRQHLCASLLSADPSAALELCSRLADCKRTRLHSRPHRTGQACRLEAA